METQHWVALAVGLMALIATVLQFGGAPGESELDEYKEEQRYLELEARLDKQEEIEDEEVDYYDLKESPYPPPPPRDDRFPPPPDEKR